MIFLFLSFCLLLVLDIGLIFPFLDPNFSLPSLPSRTVAILASLSCLLFLWTISILAKLTNSSLCGPVNASLSSSATSLIVLFLPFLPFLTACTCFLNWADSIFLNSASESILLAVISFAFSSFSSTVRKSFLAGRSSLIPFFISLFSFCSVSSSSLVCITSSQSLSSVESSLSSNSAFSAFNASAPGT